jgi:integrase
MIAKPEKPEKPFPEFPLFPHDTKRWAKKINGKLRYFGPWSDPEGALARYHAEFGNGGDTVHAATAPKRRKRVKKGNKPDKPYEDFPLYAHSAGQWAKRIKGKLHYFGTWDDPDAALELYKHQVDDIQNGRPRRPIVGGITLKELFDRFLTSRKRDVVTGELDQRTYDDYEKVCRRAADCLGKTREVASLHPDDFARVRTMFAKRQTGKGTVGLVTLDNYINRLRCVFSWAKETGLLKEEMNYGKEFERPNKKSLRIERGEKPKKMFEAEEIKNIIARASGDMKAFVLLGINCGFENMDCAKLRFANLDLKRGWIDFPRPKTGAERRCPLWPETVAAIEWSVENRPGPNAGNEEYVFITKHGNLWCNREATPGSAITRQMTRILEALEIRRQGVNFLALRHTFQTIGESSGDIYAVKTIMGHTEDAGDMSPVYREKMDDSRLRAVTDTVRKWVGLK